MGTIIQARCACGFESGRIFAGGGFKSFEHLDAQPALCMKCMELVVRNYFDKESTCPACGEKVTFYKDPELQAPNDTGKRRWPPPSALEKIMSSQLRWEMYGDPDVQYLCPKCRKFTMKFFRVGDWD